MRRFVKNCSFCLLFFTVWINLWIHKIIWRKLNLILIWFFQFKIVCELINFIFSFFNISIHVLNCILSILNSCLNDFFFLICSLKTLFSFSIFKILLDYLHIWKHCVSQTVLLTLWPTSNVRSTIVKEINTLTMFLICIILSVIRSAVRPNICTNSILDWILPISGKFWVVCLNSDSESVHLIFAVFSDISTLVSKYELAKTIHLALFHLSLVNLTVSSMMNSERVPLIIQPESFIFCEAIVASVDTEPRGFSL